MTDHKLLAALEKRQLSHAKKGLALAFFSGLLWAASGTALYMASGEDPFRQPAEALGLIVAAALALAMLHDSTSAVMGLIFNTLNGKSKEYLRTLRTRPGKFVCLGAIMGGPVGLSGALLGLTLAGSAYAMPITATYPALAAVLSTVFLKERNPPRVWGGILFCIAGAVVIGYAPAEETANFKLGIALSCLATLGWAAEGVISTYGMDTLDPDVLVNMREIVSSLTFALVVLPGLALSGFMGGIPGWSIALEALASPAVRVVILAGCFGCVSGFMWYRALNSAGVARAMALNICYALWAVLLGVWLTDQELTFQALAGAGLIVAGALLVMAKPRELFSLRNI